MKLIAKIFIISLFSSLGSIIGVLLSKNFNYNFYVFYWFVATTSFLFSLQGFFNHTLGFLINYTRRNIELINLHIYIVNIIVFIYIILWLSLSILVVINFTYENGEIISVFFGICNFILWCIFLSYSSSYWYLFYKKKMDIIEIVNKNNIELNNNNQLVNVNVNEEFPSIRINELSN